MIRLYTPAEIKILRKAGRILAAALQELVQKSTPGRKTKELDSIAQEILRSFKVEPTFLGYGQFPAALCTSINDEVVHGVPGERVIQKGDLVSLDFGLRYKGLCVDKAVSFYVGKVDDEKERFLQTVYQALMEGIKQAQPNHRLGEVSFAIQKIIQGAHYHIIKDLFGHGVGYQVHEEPEIPNFGDPNEGPVLKPGMVLAIEPMAGMTSGAIRVKQDGFTITSADGGLTAHFEETIAITENGPLILTVK